MIYITGDTHIPIDISKLNTKHFPLQKNLTKDDYLIITGDFGGVWRNDREEAYWRGWLDKKPFTTLFIDGNHENFNLLSTFETVDFCGGKAHKISKSIFHLMRGQVYEIDNKKLFTFGGASSHDKAHRTEGVSWWKEELPSKSELDTAILNLKKCNNAIDYIITHCAPTSIQQLLMPTYISDLLTDFFDTLKDELAFKKWYFGHYHQDTSVNDKFRCLYNSIESL